MRSEAARAAAPLAVVALGLATGAAIAVAGLPALYLAAAALACGFILWDFRVGVVLLIVMLPISRSAVFPHALFGLTGLNPLNLLVVATLAACLLRSLADGRLGTLAPRALLGLYVVPLAIAAAIGATHVSEIAPVFSMYELVEFHDVPGYLRELFAKPLMLVVFAVLVAAAVESSERPERFLVPALASIWVMAALVVGYVVLSGAGLAELASAGARETLSALGLHANELGRLFLVAYALLLFTWARETSAGARTLLLASMGLAATALALTFSRAAFAGFLLVNALFVLRHFNVRTIALALAVACAGAFALPDALFERAAAGFGGGADAVSAGRLEGLWRPLAPEVLAHPFFGNGLGSILWSEAMRVGAGSVLLGTTHPHSAFLEAALDLGLVGLACVCAYFAHAWRRLRELSADESVGARLQGFFAGAAAGLASLIAVGVVDSSFAPRPEQAFLWFAIGMMYGQLRRRSAGSGA